jgi:hypothetical protein
MAGLLNLIERFQLDYQFDKNLKKDGLLFLDNAMQDYTDREIKTIV